MKNYYVYAVNFRGMVKRMASGSKKECEQFIQGHVIPKGDNGTGQYTLKISTLSQKQAERELRL